jgi:hypothetical protein
MGERYQSRIQLPQATVQLFDDDGIDAGLRQEIDGVWETVPWAYGGECYALTLESGQSLHIWLEGITDREQAPSRLVLE